MDTDRVAGCLLGMAFGDALGADTEFLQIDDILHKYPPSGPQELQGYPARVTDDTQMALAVGEALLAARQPFRPYTLEIELRRTFVEWMVSPENTRAPGRTCMSACRKLQTGVKWQQASRTSSKGCGANMRVMPVGLLNLDTETRAKMAQFQAALTHGHPTGLAAADLTAFLIAELRADVPIDQLLDIAREYALDQREIYHEDWLGPLWKYSTISPIPQGYMAHGWDECLAALDRVKIGLQASYQEASNDPCLVTGAGWVAEEALATALLCFLAFPDNPLAVVRRAAVTSGDSDSIACIAGALAGAYHGLSAWPQDWMQRIEYRDRLDTLITQLVT